MKHGKFVKAVATLAVFTAMGAMMAACGGETHNLTRHDARSATCTQEGNIEYWDCSHCDKLFADEKGEKEVKDIVVPKTPHDIDDEDFHEAVPSDCENDGTFAYYECQACHKKFTNKDGTKEIEDIVDPAAHTSVHAERVEPTLDKAGNKEYWKCTACQKYFLEEEMINPVEEAETVIPKLEEYDVDLTLAVTDKIGQAITDYSAWNNRRVHLTHTNEYLNKTYVAKIGMDGKLSFVTVAQDETETDAASKMGEGTYTVVVTGGGYYEATLTIGKSGNTKTIETEEIEHTFHVGILSFRRALENRRRERSIRRFYRRCAYGQQISRRFHGEIQILKWRIVDVTLLYCRGKRYGYRSNGLRLYFRKRER